MTKRHALMALCVLFWSALLSIQWYLMILGGWSGLFVLVWGLVFLGAIAAAVDGAVYG